MTDMPSPLDFYDAPQAPPLPAPAEPPAETGFFENIRVGWQEMGLVGNPGAENAGLHDAYEPIVEALNDGLPAGERLRNPADIDDGAAVRFGQRTRAQEQARLFAELARRQARGELTGLPSNAVEFQRRFREKRAAALGRIERVKAGATGLGTIGGFAGGVAGSFRDPANIVALPFGGFGKTIAMRLGTEALVNMGVELAEQPGVASNYRDLGVDYGLGDAAFSVLAAGAGAAAIRGGGEALAKGGPAAFRSLFPELAEARDAKAFGRAMERVVKGGRFTGGEDVASRLFSPGAGFSFERSLSAGTIDVRAVTEAFRASVPEEMRTPSEQAALHVLDRQAEIFEASPFEAGPAGDLAHVERLSDAMAALLDGRTPETAPLVAGAAAREPGLAGDDIGRGGARFALPRETVDTASAMAAFKAKVRSAESGGDDAARNPRSSASGRYQFTDDTFVRTYWKVFGPGSATRADILARKTDPELQERLMQRLTADNAAALKRDGLPVTPGTLYLLHFAGEGGGKAILKAAPDTPVERILGPDAVRRNRSVLEGKSASEVIAWANRRMGGEALASEPAGFGPPMVRRDAYAEEAASAEAELAAMDAAFGERIEATDWSDAVEKLKAAQSGWVPGMLFHPEVGEIGIPWGRATKGDGQRPFGLAHILEKHDDEGVIENLPDIILGMEVVGRDADRVDLASADYRAGISLNWHGESGTWLISAFRRPKEGGAPPSPEPNRGDGGGRDGSPGLGAGADIGASGAKGKARRGPPRRPTVLRVIASLGGLRDDEGHDLVAGRGVPEKLPFVGRLISEDGVSVDALGEELWDLGFFGKPSQVDRPSEADVLDLVDRALQQDIGLPEDELARVVDGMHAGAPDEEEALDYLRETAAEMGLGAADDELLGDALIRYGASGDAEGALTQAVNARLDLARAEDAAAAWALADFDDPVGPAAKAQSDSLEHDLRMAASAIDPSGMDYYDFIALGVGDPRWWDGPETAEARDLDAIWNAANGGGDIRFDPPELPAGELWFRIADRAARGGYGERSAEVLARAKVALNERDFAEAIRSPEGVQPGLFDGGSSKSDGIEADTRGRGQQYHGARGEVPDLTEGYYNPANIYGGGDTFYTTDALDIARGYGRKRAAARVYRVEEVAPVRFFDMEEAHPPAFFDRLFGVGDEDIGLVPAAIEEAATEAAGAPNLRQVMDMIRDLSGGEGVSRDEVQEIFDIAIYNLRQGGFGGMRHVGGLKRGKAPHNVQIYFDAPNQVRLIEEPPVDGRAAAAFATRETGLPVGGFYAVDRNGDILVPPDHRPGAMPKRFKTEDAALKAAPDMVPLRSLAPGAAETADLPAWAREKVAATPPEHREEMAAAMRDVVAASTRRAAVRADALAGLPPALAARIGPDGVLIEAGELVGFVARDAKGNTVRFYPDRSLLTFTRKSDERGRKMAETKGATVEQYAEKLGVELGQGELPTFRLDAGDEATIADIYDDLDADDAAIAATRACLAPGGGEA